MLIFDLHCHCREGSPDAIVSIKDTIAVLKLLGYDGMLITDHDSYNGYKSLVEKPKDFVVLKGIEYDTLDAGHVLIVLPTEKDYPIFEYRGMKIEDVIKIVHSLGGVIGAAHPYDCSKLGICNTKYRANYDILSQFDFIETYNGSSLEYKRKAAISLAKLLNKPCTGGSDSHTLLNVGLVQTEIDSDIKTEDDLIRVIKEGDFESLKVHGEIQNFSSKNLHKLGSYIGGYAWNFITILLSIRHNRTANLFLDAVNSLDTIDKDNF